jgi:hypothetical protein
MIRKSGHRFSEKIMLQLKNQTMIRFNLIGSWSGKQRVMAMSSVIERHIIARESNVVRVDFSRDPDPPAPCFPGANGLRLSDAERDGASAVSTVACGAGLHTG